jgi:glutamyl-tRNA synthetase
MGYLPQAVVNYLVRLGWSYGNQEEFTLKELIEKFSLEAVGKAAAAINPGKLDWLNSQYMKRMEPEELAEKVLPFIEDRGYRVTDRELLKKVVLSLRERSKTLVEMAELADFYFREEVLYEEKAAQKFLTPESLPLFELALEEISKESHLERETGHRFIQKLSEKRQEPLVKIAQPLRLALTGRTASPPLDEVMEALGKERVIQRLQRATEYIAKSEIRISKSEINPKSK